jgi:hypothetical protein
MRYQAVAFLGVRDSHLSVRCNFVREADHAVSQYSEGASENKIAYDAKSTKADRALLGLDWCGVNS